VSGSKNFDETFSKNQIFFLYFLKRLYKFGYVCQARL
jgi:hypothetical protein